jgi:hypothetical protein
LVVLDVQVLAVDRAPAGRWGELIADGMSCPPRLRREHCFIRSLMVLPLAAADRGRRREMRCCSWEMTGLRTITTLS